MRTGCHLLLIRDTITPRNRQWWRLSVAALAPYDSKLPYPRSTVCVREFSLLWTSARRPEDGRSPSILRIWRIHMCTFSYTRVQYSSRIVLTRASIQAWLFATVAAALCYLYSSLAAPVSPSWNTCSLWAKRTQDHQCCIDKQQQDSTTAGCEILEMMPLSSARSLP